MLGILALCKTCIVSERVKKTRGVIFIVSFLFFLGIAFGILYLPLSWLISISRIHLSPLIEISLRSLTFLKTLFILQSALVCFFKCRCWVMILARIGIVNAKFLRKYRRHAFVIILIAAAIITPSTDPFSLTIVTIPLYILYEASIAVASRINKRQQKEMNEWS
ncbi:MAG: twin-arginine translocase subunit TatC [Chitinophagaceae bacterium]